MIIQFFWDITISIDTQQFVQGSGTLRQKLNSLCMKVTYDGQVVVLSNLSTLFYFNLFMYCGKFMAIYDYKVYQIHRIGKNYRRALLIKYLFKKIIINIYPRNR